MAGAGYVVELVFGGLGLVRGRTAAKISGRGVSWDCATWLDIVLLLPAAVLPVRFVRAGGAVMLKMMGGAPPASPPFFAAVGEARAGHDMHDRGTSRAAGTPASRRAAAPETPPIPGIRFPARERARRVPIHGTRRIASGGWFGPGDGGCHLAG